MSISVITKPRIDIAPDLLKKLKEQAQEEGQVIVHCVYQAQLPWGSAIRIWPSTFLLDQDSDHQSNLVHMENITLYPEWTPCDPFSTTHFTLYFKGLPESCETFDLEEFCAGSGGEFVVRNIERNETDIYFLSIS